MAPQFGTGARQTGVLIKEKDMEQYDLVKFLHAGIGTIALTTFWLSGLTRKGSTVHKASGKIYLLAMTGILLSAVPMTVAFFTRVHPVAAAFLAYLLVITATSVWCSWRAIRDKRDWSRYTSWVYRMLLVLNGLSGLGIAYLGLFVTNQMALIFTAFSFIGLLNAFRMWRFQRQAPADPRWWLKEHIGAMIGNGVATHIAFLSIGLPKLMPMLSGPLLQNLAWLAPLTLSVFAGIYLNRKYVPTRKNGQTPVTASARSRSAAPQ
jgi:uncharacterized membrane protein